MESINYKSFVFPSINSTLTSDFHKIISQNLKSPKMSDKHTALKTILSSRNINVSDFFPLILQEITSEDETLRHLSYIFLVQFASKFPNLILLSINTFQRNLIDNDFLLRALSLKILTSLHFPDISQTVLESITRAASDISPYVRKAAALSLIANPDSSILKKLISDSSPYVFDGVLFAIWKNMKHEESLTHSIFRNICEILLKLDPFSQVFALKILQRYSRQNFQKPHDNWILDENDQHEDESDLKLLFRTVYPLLSSIVNSVVLEACSVIFYCSSPSIMQVIVKPLIRLIYSENTYTVLISILGFISEESQFFVPLIRHFFINFEDLNEIKILKMKILSSLTRISNCDIIIHELSDYIYDPNIHIAMEAIKSIGKTISISQDFTSIMLLVNLIESSSKFISSQAIYSLCLAIRSENSLDQSLFKSILLKMLSMFLVIDDDVIKSHFISFIGDCSDLIFLQAHEILRLLTVDFLNLSIPLKHQTLNLAAKLYSINKQNVKDLVQFVLNVACYDQNIDIRDKSFFLISILFDNSLFENAKKLVVSWEADVSKINEFEVGTFSQIFSKNFDDCSRVVPWPENIKAYSSTTQDIETSEKEVLVDEEENIEHFFLQTEEECEPIEDTIFEETLDFENYFS